MEFLFFLEDSPLGMAVSGSSLGYLIALSSHALGMAILVGVSLMLAFRAMGFASAIPLIAMAPYWQVALYGFVINLLSGTVLFIGNASSLAINPAFLVKIGFIIVGFFTTRLVVKTAFNNKKKKKLTIQNRLLAILAIILWLAALTSGRLIGYVS